jgi:NDP-sugar pyrophosphorylase family protein
MPDQAPQFRRREDITRPGRTDIQAAVVAGGAGTRLRPITDVLPKLLVPVGGRTVLDCVLDTIEPTGVPTVHLLLGFHADLIRAYLAIIRKRRPSLRIRPHVESRTLGTAGPLRLLDGVAEHLLVLNGDIVTGANLKPVLDDHLESRADMTVVCVPYEVAVPFGVVETGEAHRVSRITEKPVLRHSVLAGIYVVGPAVRAMVRESGPDDMPELIERALMAGLLVREHRLAPETPWCEVGEPSGYLAAQRMARPAGD